MAPKRRQRRLKNEDAIPDVYREMLVEAAASGAHREEANRPRKRRRVGGEVVQQTDVVYDGGASSPLINPVSENNDIIVDQWDEWKSSTPPPPQQQVVRSDSEDSADSDVDWENVNLKTEDDESVDGLGAPVEAKQLNLVLDTGGSKYDDRPKRKAVTALEKKLRLEIHKVNLCCLMIHAHIRNHWCNDEEIQGLLRRYLTARTVSYLTPDESLGQFQRSRSFMDGLSQISEIIRGAFRKTARGMAKPQWSLPEQKAQNQIPDDIELPMQRQDFAEAARDMAGSRDTGTQLLCCMLRAIGVDARLVCSLQPFQFRAVEKTATPQKQYTAYVPHNRSRQGTPERDQGSGEDNTPYGKNLVDRRKAPKRPIKECKFPIYWVEAFNAAVQKWVPVDPIVTQTIAKPHKMEPSLGERDNDLSYVIAFEDDGSAHDVTRRYAKAYNAKTRRDRIESTKGGQRWWRRMMKVFRRRLGALDRDQLEAAELAGIEAAEPMPRNVVDFKDHPYYALERHLRRNEVIHPKREVGKVGATGKGHNATSLELVYRRRDVQFVQSREKWFRVGREVKAGETPLKIVVPMSRKGRRPLDNDDDEEVEESLVDRAGTPLFSVQQTSLYRAEPVLNGWVPRNQYGNLDVYVPSMIPAGGAHVQHPAASRAAKTLGIQYADAVTGFKFSGRHGTAVINGAIIAAECVDAMREVITAIEDEKAAIEQEKRAAAAMATWRKFLIGLRIRERIKGYDIEGEDQETKIRDQAGKTEDASEEEGDEDEGGGGFFPDPDASMDIEPMNTAKDHQIGSDGEDPYDSPISVLERPPPIIPVIFGPPLAPTSPKPATPLKSPGPDLFDDDNDRLTRETTAEPETQAIQAAIAESLAVSEQESRGKAKTNHGQETGESNSMAAISNGMNVAAVGVSDNMTSQDHIRVLGGDGGPAMKEGKDSRAQSEGGDMSDPGSLMSHDPEDEEAEDWPESAGEEYDD